MKIGPVQAALFAAAAEAMFDPKFPTIPHADARLDGWEIDGTFKARNALLGGQRVGLGDPVFYGFVAHRPDEPDNYVAVIRGTEQPIEWIEDLEFLPYAHPLGGMVEHGFWSIYRSMTYEPENKTPALGAAPAVRGMWEILRGYPGRTLTFIGHSLGSALATYLTIDTAAARQPNDGAVRAMLFASPRPGDAMFAHEFHTRVGAENYTVYNYVRDVVPRVPFGFERFGLGYHALLNVEHLKKGPAQFGDDIVSAHNAMNYAALLGYQAATPKPVGVEI